MGALGFLTGTAGYTAILAAFGLAVAGVLGVQETPWQSIGLQVAGAVFTLAAFIARLTYQKGLSQRARRRVE